MEDFDLYSDYYTIPTKKSTSVKKSVIHHWKDPTLSSQKTNQKQVEKNEVDLEASLIADRALL